MICRWTFPQVSRANTFLRSRSVVSTFRPSDSPQRVARRWMWVSTGKAGMPNAWFETTDAVLCPTPGSSSSSARVRGPRRRGRSAGAGGGGGAAAPRVARAHRRRLVPDARKLLELGEGPRHLAAVPLGQDLGEALQVLRLGAAQADAPDQIGRASRRAGVE